MPYTGLLVVEGNDLILRCDEGGYWRLDADNYRHVGKRVSVDGQRAGFDLLDVTSITPLSGTQD